MAGQYYDAETGHHYNWHRHYDPATGRYLTTDPIGLAGGINLYAYVHNDPVNYVDPEGLFIFAPQAIGAAISLGFEGYRQYQSGDFSFGRLLVAAGTGALGGFGSTLGRALFFGATSNILNTAYQQYNDPCQEVDLEQLIRSGAFGAIGGSIGFGGGAIGKKLFWPTKVIGRPVGRMPSQHFQASGAAFGAATGGYIANQ